MTLGVLRLTNLALHASFPVHDNTAAVLGATSAGAASSNIVLILTGLLTSSGMFLTGLAAYITARRSDSDDKPRKRRRSR